MNNNITKDCNGCIHENTPPNGKPCIKCSRLYMDQFEQRRISDRAIIDALKMMDYETSSNRRIAEDIIKELELREEEDEGED